LSVRLPPGLATGGATVVSPAGVQAAHTPPRPMARVTPAGDAMQAR